MVPVEDLSPTIARAVGGRRGPGGGAPRDGPEQRAACADFARRFARDLQLRPRVEALTAGVWRLPVVDPTRVEVEA